MTKRSFMEYCLQQPLVKQHSRKTSYRKGELLYRSGSKIEAIGLVVKGLLRTSSYTREGKELCSAIFTEHSVVSEYLYLTKSPIYSFDLITAAPSTVCWIPTNIFEKIAMKDPQGMVLYVEHLAHRGIENQRLIKCLTYKTIRERICYWIASTNNNLSLNLEDIPQDLVIPGSQEVYSALLHVTRASISYEINRMEAEGFFIREGHHLQAIDRQRILKNL